MRTRLASGAAFFLSISGFAQSAQAELVTYSFNGTVIDGDSVGVPGFNFIIGQPKSGVLTYELDAPGTIIGQGPNGVAEFVSYTSPRVRLVMTIGGDTVQGRATIFVGNSNASATLESDVDTFFAILNIDSPSPMNIFLRLEDTTDAVFASPRLPASVVSHKQLELFFRFFSGTWPSTSGLNGLQSLATALEFFHDGLDGGFPNKRLGIFVPGICKFLDGGDEIGDT